MDAHGVLVIADQGRTLLRLYGPAHNVDAAQTALLLKAQQLNDGPKAVVHDRRNDLLGAFANLSIKDDDQSNCAVCLTPSENPFTTNCGHMYCKLCLASQTAWTPEYPVRCLDLSGNCNEPLTFRDLWGVLPVSEYDALLVSSLTKHLRTHPSEFQYCPTSDCDRFYRTSSSEDAIIFDCDRCLSSVCTACHRNPHEGQTCAEAKSDTKASKKWRKENDVRDCPSCNMLIEKTEGCNHMECASCGTHMCWKCMKTFKSGPEVCGHLTDRHNGDWGIPMRENEENDEDEE